MKFNLGKKLGTHEVDGIQVGKKIVSSVAAYGAGVILFSIVQKHLPEGMKLHTRMAVVLGTWALVNVGKDAVTAHTDKTIDEALKFFQKLSESIEKAAQKAQSETDDTAPETA